MQSKGAERNAVVLPLDPTGCSSNCLLLSVATCANSMHLSVNGAWECLFHAFIQFQRGLLCLNLKALMTTFMMISKDFLSLILIKIV